MYLALQIQKFKRTQAAKYKAVTAVTRQSVVINKSSMHRIPQVGDIVKRGLRGQREKAVALVSEKHFRAWESVLEIFVVGGDRIRYGKEGRQVGVGVVEEMRQL